MDKQEIERLLIAVDMDLRSLIDNLRGDAQSHASVLKTSVLISLEHLEVDRKRIQQARDELKKD